MNLYSPSGSRKLTGLVICLTALLVLVALAIAAMWAFDVGWELFGAIGTQITTLGAAHQTAQAAADRSSNYPNVPMQTGGAGVNPLLVASAPPVPPTGPRIP